VGGKKKNLLSSHTSEFVGGEKKHNSYLPVQFQSDILLTVTEIKY
jgi:hypothetical protein